MTDAAEFIEEFLEHDQERDKAKIAAYNRQYYLRNRKLKGSGGASSRSSLSSSERKQIAAEKIRRAMEAAKKLPPDKRNAVERKLADAENKLRNLNPFKKDKKDKKEQSKPDYAQSSKENERRISEARAKLVAARKKAKEGPPGDRDKIEARIKAAEIALKSMQRNPFKGAKVKGPKNPFEGAKVKVPNVKRKAKATRKASSIAAKTAARKAALNAFGKVFGD